MRGNPFLMLLIGATEPTADDFTGIGNENKGGWLFLFDELTQLHGLCTV